MATQISNEPTMDVHVETPEMIELKGLANTDPESKVELSQKAIASPSSSQNVEENISGKLPLTWNFISYNKSSNILYDMVYISRIQVFKFALDIKRIFRKTFE